MAESAPCSGYEGSLIGARTSLFAKLGNLGTSCWSGERLVAPIAAWRGVLGISLYFTVDGNLPPPGFKMVANLVWGLTALMFSRLVRRTPGPPEPP